MKQRLIFLLVCLAGFLTAGAQKYVYEIGDEITTNTGKYIVKGANIISNPSFDDGTTGWIAGDGSDLSDSYFDVPATGGADGGPYLKALSGAGSGSNKSIKTSFPITSGKTYYFSCWALRTNNGGNMQYSRLYLARNERGTDNQIATVKYVQNEWAQTETIFEAGEYSFFTVNLGWLDSASSFDCFTLLEVESSDEIMTDKLSDAIAAAEARLEATEEGNDPGQFTTATRQALQTAIDAAKAVLAAAASQEAVNQAVTDLNAAVSTYNKNVNPPFQVGKQYMFLLYPNQEVALSSGGDGGTVRVQPLDEEDLTQVFTFELVPEDAAAAGYNMKDGNGNYVYRSGSWDTKSRAEQDLTNAAAIFTVIDRGSYVQIHSEQYDNVMGVDNTTPGSAVYSNKSGTGNNNRWILKEYVPADQRDAEYNFNNLLNKAQNELNSISSSAIGNGLFQYSKSAYDAYSDAIAVSQQMTDFVAAKEYLQSAMDEFAANAVNKPNPEAEYVITQVSGAHIGCLEDNTHGVLSDESETFKIVAAEAAGAYYLQHVTTGKYLAKSGSSSWDTTWEEETGNNTAQWAIAQYGEGIYTIQNLSNKGYLGSDATTAGSSLYCDKSASAENSHWTIIENSVSGIVDGAIEKAEQLLANTEVGSEYYQVPQSAADALQEAINKAKSDKQNATLETASKIVAELNEAISIFRNSFNPMGDFDTELTYYIQHYGGAVLTAVEEGNATITTLVEEGKPADAQKIYLEKVGSSYYVKSVTNETYLSVSGTYDTRWLSEPDETSLFNIVQLSGKYIGLYNISKGTYFGTDATASGNKVYSDKNAVENSYWLVITYQDLDRTLFNEAVEAAQAYAESMVEGYKVGEYMPDVISEYAEVITNAQAASKKAADQESLNQMAADLKASIDIYIAKANSENRASDYLKIIIEQAEAEAAIATVGVDKGQYQQTVLDAFKKAIGSAKISSDAEKAIANLNQARETFRNSANSIDRSALKSAIATAESAINGAVVGDANGNYPQGALDTYKLALTEAQTIYGDINKTQEEVEQATEALNNAAAVFAAQKVVIDYALLKETITSAQKTINDNNALKGEGSGTYPESAFTALQQAIEEAQTYVTSTTANQQAVDAAADKLVEAIDAFEASFVPVDYSELEALLDAAKSALESYRSFMAADDIEELEYAIGVGEEAMKSRLQSDVNRAVKILNRDYQLFNSIATAIDSIMAGNKVEGTRIYNLNGAIVSGVPAKGVYIIQMNVEGRVITKKFMVK
ncbi:MAG: FIVAR domain-containing protein [Bacteroidaceae bacterium]|nr:FIVAR domain-containing protein [Bacteroidaceae bacterium]